MRGRYLNLDNTELATRAVPELTKLLNDEDQVMNAESCPYTESEISTVFL